MDNEAGRFTLIFLGVPGDEGGEVELTYNWDERGYDGGRNFGHLAYQVDDIYATCQRLMDARRHHQPPAARRPHGLRSLARRHLDRAAAEGRRAGPGRALGVDAEHRRMVDWPDRRWLELVGASIRSSRRRWPAPATSLSVSRRATAAHWARCRAQ